MFQAEIFTGYTTQHTQSTDMVFGTNYLFKEQWGYVVPLSEGMSWLIFNISSISDPESFRNAIFYYQKIRRKILRRIHSELTARCYAPPYFVDEQKNAQNLRANTIQSM